MKKTLMLLSLAICIIATTAWADASSIVGTSWKMDTSNVVLVFGQNGILVSANCQKNDCGEVFYATYTINGDE